MLNDPAYPKPNHCDNCGDVLDTHYGEWYREECYCKTCGLPLCRDCYDEHLWDDHMAPEVRREFEQLQIENSNLLRKFDRAAELLRRIRKENPLLSTDIARDARTFLDGLEGSDG